uniref:Putative monocarboxylate transporter n=1 Tax=Ixodes ricinus TaxID=34613 RepID=A0A0K8RFE7_IXORI
MLMGLSIFKLPMFYVITYSFISFNLSYDCYNSLFIDFTIDKGIPMSSAVTMTSLSAVPDLVGDWSFLL